MDIYTILNNLDHRNSFLMVDRILEITEDSIIARKNITATEPCFSGHFPERPIFPGVLIIESMAQTCGLLVRHRLSSTKKREGYLVEVEKVKFFKILIPGDIINVKAVLSEQVMNYYRFSCTVTSESNRIAKGNITLLINNSE